MFCSYCFNSKFLWNSRQCSEKLIKNHPKILFFFLEAISMLTKFLETLFFSIPRRFGFVFGFLKCVTFSNVYLCLVAILSFLKIPSYSPIWPFQWFATTFALNCFCLPCKLEQVGDTAKTLSFLDAPSKKILWTELLLFSLFHTAKT